MHFLGRHVDLILVVALIFLSLGYARADSDDSKAQGIAKQSACLGCHATNKKIVGPSFQEVAKKYAGDSNSKALLKNKILKGGAGSWGVIPMPANAKLNDADLSALASWILRGAPAGN